METNPEIEFEFFLAEKLGMTVSRLRREVSVLELGQWFIYFARRAQRQEMARK